MPKNLENRKQIWYFRAVINGKLFRKSTGFQVGTRPNLQAAQRRASEFETAIRSEALGWLKPPAPLFRVWADLYLNVYHPGRYTEQVLMRRPLKLWADRPLNSLAQSEIRAYFNDRQAEGAKPGTLERERALLAGLFRAAVADQKIEHNPLQGIGVFRTTPRDRVLSRDDEKALRGIVAPMWDRFLTVALTAGLRRKELLGLRPRDLREKGTWVWVNPENNKTRTERLVPLREETREALDEQAASRQGGDDTPYFDVELHTPSILMARWCKRLGIPVRTPHDLRRTFGTRCAEAGMYPKHLQQILGHTSIEISMRYYVHLEKRSVADALQGVTL